MSFNNFQRNRQASASSTTDNQPNKKLTGQNGDPKLPKNFLEMQSHVPDVRETLVDVELRLCLGLLRPAVEELQGSGHHHSGRKTHGHAPKKSHDAKHREKKTFLPYLANFPWPFFQVNESNYSFNL
jgi:hypothetical protein